MSSAYGVRLKASCRIQFCRYLTKVLCLYNYYNLFYRPLINRYYNRPLPLLREFLPVPNLINKLVNLTGNCSTSCINLFCWNLIKTWKTMSFYPFNSFSTSKILDSGISGSAMCISLCLPSLTSCTSNSWDKCFLHLAKILWESATKLSLLSSRTMLFLDW